MSGRFRHHSQFLTDRQVLGYLFPYVCFSCRKSFKRPPVEEARLCPDCGTETVRLSRKFKAPPKAATKRWQVVEYLVSKGFRYDSVQAGDGQQARFPTTLREAEEFAKRWAGQAYYRDTT